MKKQLALIFILIIISLNTRAEKSDKTISKYHSEPYSSLIDSLYSSNFKSKKNALKELYLAGEKEERMFYLTRENYYNEALLKKNSNFLLFTVEILFFLTISGYAAFWIYKTKEKNKKLMFEENIKSAIIEKEKKFADIVRLLPQIIFETNRTGYFTFINQQCIKKTGFTESEIYLLSINDIIFNNVSQKPLNVFIREDFEQMNEKEFLLKRVDNTFLPIIMYINSVYLDNNYFGCRGIIFDISERKEIEEKIIKTIISTEERERKRFSKDLHDTIGPLLSTLKLYVNEFESDKYSREEKDNLLKEINIIINDTISYSREISHNITPVVLKDYGIWKSLNIFIQKINSLNKVEIIFKCKNEEIRYNDFFEINIYRIVLELIQNSIKHSNATHIVIDISEINRLFRLSYYDNGTGFNYNQTLDKSDGMGLINLISRTKTIKGLFNIQTSEGEGFTFLMTCQLDDSYFNLPIL